MSFLELKLMEINRKLDDLEKESKNKGHFLIILILLYILVKL